MPIHDDVSVIGLKKLFRFGTPQLMTMRHQHSHPIEQTFDLPAERWIAGNVCISIHCLNRRNETQLLENGIATDIARMEDKVDTSQCQVDFRTDESMGI
jgi:hypothetical protein